MNQNQPSLLILLVPIGVEEMYVCDLYCMRMHLNWMSVPSQTTQVCHIKQRSKSFQYWLSVLFC